ncbi:E3 SUMO-protein ligase ZBED1-like [Pimephales promelas]|uniref:E3 SUMO-protein ligase ZBED1-like n=1 Tax=Pimephales promelas TaxID=90988 RepID=UPI001955A70F|nr:E3 SUMO-protein ligase ZBED1-like [Pimephales promelas]
MLNVLEPRYSIPSRKRMSEEIIPKLYNEVKQKITLSLTTADRVALTCDGWTSRHQDTYVTITCHYLDDWVLISNVLQTRAMQDSHTGANICALLSDALEEWGLTKKDPIIVTNNNATNMIRAVEMMELLHIGCFAHTINLASQAALKLPAISRLLGRVRRIVTFFHRSANANKVFKEKQRLLNLPCRKLTIDVVTRWNSALDMLDRFLEQQPAISAALLSPELLDEMRSTAGDSTVIKELKSAIHDNLRFRYANLKEKLYVASALDPRFKTLPFISDEEREDTFTTLISEIVTLEQVKQQGSDSAGNGGSAPVQEQKSLSEGDSDPSPAPPKRSKESCALLDLLGAAYVCAPVADRAREEVGKYREVTPIPLSDDPLKWWCKHEGVYPLLSLQAKRYLCVPGTSVPAERIFSTAGDIITAQRSCLLPEHVDQLLFLQKNYSFQ